MMRAGFLPSLFPKPVVEQKKTVVEPVTSTLGNKMRIPEKINYNDERLKEAYNYSLNGNHAKG